MRKESEKRNVISYFETFRKQMDVTHDIGRCGCTGSPSSLGNVNMTLRKNVFIRICMGINRSYEIVQNKRKK